MYVVIVGGGDVGEATAKRLEKHGVKVTIIDKDEKICEHLIQVTRANIICGDATNPRVLNEANIDKADYLIAVTGDDHTNLIVSILAKKYGVKNIILRIIHPVYEATCRMLGLENIVNPAETTAVQIDAIVRGIKLIDLVSIAEKNIDVEEIEVKGELVGLESVEVDRKMKGSADVVYPIMIIRKEEILLPEPGLKLREGDKLLVIRRRKRKLPIF